MNDRLQAVVGVQAAASAVASPDPVDDQSQGQKSDGEASPVCPKCSGEMILRTAKSGENKGRQFWGCVNYPRCRSILPFEEQEAPGESTE
ncbi:MAG: topoisomerase DNA-binding C4 zinc finger domain-containing protein [Thermodesulfobacteriota bacterium]